MPTINESGYKGFDAATWFGLLAPVAVLVALTGALLIFVPGFFD